MNEPNKVAEAIQALATSSTARTKMGRLRELLPQIEAAQAAGVTHQHILDTLNEQGFALDMKSYSVMLFRIRKRKTSEPADQKVGAAAPQGLTPKKEDGKSVAAPSTTAIVKPDKRPGDPANFDWQAQRAKKTDW